MISTSGHLIPKFPEVRFHRTRIFNVFGPDYTYELETYCPLNNYEINSNAKKEVADLYEIFNS